MPISGQMDKQIVIRQYKETSANHSCLPMCVMRQWEEEEAIAKHSWGGDKLAYCYNLRSYTFQNLVNRII